jgi:arsenite methyltransferase
MAAMMALWEGHSAHPRLPMSMAEKFIKAGFHFDDAVVFPILNLQYDDDSYSWGLAQIVRNFVAGKNDVSADDLKDWHSELERLSEAERYFFSSNRYIFKASKPSSDA